MAKLPTRAVTHEEIDAIFAGQEIWDKIQDGRLTTEPIAERSLPSWGYPNSISEIIKHYDPDGNHIATSHRVIDNENEQIHHWDAKDIVIDGIRYVRS